MSDDSEFWKAHKRQQQKHGTDRRASALLEFENAKALADKHGLILLCRTESHYQLRPKKGKWIINIYPGNRRIYADPKRERAPFLSVPDNWTITDAVNATIVKI